MITVGMPALTVSALRRFPANQTFRRWGAPPNVYKADGKRKKFHLPASVIMCFQPKKNCQDGRPKTDRLWENDLLRELGVLND